MIYLIREKKTKDILYDLPAQTDENLKGKEFFPDFNAKSMEVLKYDGDNPPENFPEHFKADKKGFLVEKTLPELARDGLMPFGKTLLKYVPITLEGDEMPGEKTNSKMVGLGLKHKLIKTIPDCQEAFRMLDEEFETRTANKYSPGLETKIMKNYIQWMQEGKPAGDKREKKYLEMNQTIDAMKEEYKEVRAALKKIIVPLQKKNQ